MLKRLALLSAMILPIFLFSQDLLDDLEFEDDSTEVERVLASFKNSRVINVQSIETVAPGVLDFRISHRFGRINGGAYELFGLDNAAMRMAFEYGVTDRFTVAIARSAYEKTYDGTLKYKLLWQTKNDNSMPISLVLYSSMSYNTLRYFGLPYERTFTTRLNYVHQLILGRKFNKKITLELLPTIVHRNFVETRNEENTVYLAALAGRYKLSQRLAVNGEYIYVLPNQLRPEFTNSFSLGVDIDTGGHIFQLHLTNSPQMLDKGFITETRGDWLNGDIHFGFNISRVFTLKKPKYE